MDEQYVIDLYRQVLGREPDPAGLAHNLGLLQSGAISASDLAGAFAGSQEAQSSPSASPSAPPPSYSPPSGDGGGGGGGNAASQVANLYQSILGRSPDAGAKGWEDLLNAGYSVEEVARQIGSSQEAQNRAVANISPEIRANDPNNFAGSVTQLYASALGRTPDAAALEANINLLNQNPDAFGWLANSVTSSPEAKAYAEKSGVDLNRAYENVVGNFAHFTPTPRQGGLAGFANQYGYLAPFLLAGGALAAPYLAGAGAAGAGAGAGAAGAGAAAGSLEAYMLAAGLNPGTFTGASFALPGSLGAGTFITPELMGPTYGELGYTGLAEGLMGPTYQELGYTGLNLGEASAAADAAAAAAAGLSPSSLLSSLGNVLKTPLGQLGAFGGLSLLSGGAGAQQQQPIPQMAGGSSTYAPRGQVDYRPILDLLAPRQISRTSLLG